MYSRFKFFIRSLFNLTQKRECPFCNSTNLEEVDRKYLVISLLNCKQCGLNHRHPKDSESFLEKFYQKEYHVESQKLMTKLPTDDEIEAAKKSGFSEIRDCGKYLDALRLNGLTILDYGCSWGYNVFKLIKSGYNSIGFEISKSRAKFGEIKLGVRVFSEKELIPKNIDAVFSSHVIEHLSDISDFISFSKSILKEDGLFIAFCPNGSNEYRGRDFDTWHLIWGSVHPNYLTVDFARYVFKNNPYLILTGDWEFDLRLLSQWDGKSQIVGENQSGEELLIISKPNLNIR